MCTKSRLYVEFRFRSFRDKRTSSIAAPKRRPSWMNPEAEKLAVSPEIPVRVVSFKDVELALGEPASVGTVQKVQDKNASNGDKKPTGHTQLPASLKIPPAVLHDSEIFRQGSINFFGPIRKISRIPRMHYIP